MLKYFPDLVYVDILPSGEYEVNFYREQVIRKLKQEESKFPNIVFTSFERGLKHAGMEVTQSTHGQTPIKKWAMKKGVQPKQLTKKTAKKRKNDGDDAAEDGGEFKLPRIRL